MTVPGSNPGRGAMKSDKEIWPFGRYEIYDSEEFDAERLNGFHTMEEAEEAAMSIDGAVVIDRADKFCW